MTLNRGRRYRTIIPPEADGELVLAFLSSRYRHSDADAWRSRLAEGLVLVEGRTAEADQRLERGQELLWQRPPWREPQVPLGFAVLHRDESLLAVAKPSGLPTLPGGRFYEHSLLRRVRRIDPDAAPVHRLGRGTSGLLLFARSPTAAAAVSAALREGRVDKLYRARVLGTPPRDEVVIETPIGPVPHPRLGHIHAASASGRPARSRVRALQHDGEHSLVEVRIDTGRPHQIRIHLASIGHPLAGDPLYAEGGVPRPDAVPGDLGYRLHALHLHLPHPRTGRPIELWCSPPPALRVREAGLSHGTIPGAVTLGGTVPRRNPRTDEEST